MNKDIHKNSCIIIIFFLIIGCGHTSSFGQNKIRFPIWTFNTTSTTIYGISFGLLHHEKVNNVKTNGLRIETLGIILFPERKCELDPFFYNDSVFSSFLVNETKETINGLSISPFGQQGDCSINGINISTLGNFSSKTNGISIAGINSSILHNGIQISYIISTSYKLNGLQIAFVNSNYKDLSGSQIGILLNGNLGALKGIQFAPFNISNEISGSQIGVLLNLSKTNLKGIQFAPLNFAGEVKGVQIGIVNKAKKMNGIQFGIININEKRILPVVNW